MEDEATQVLPTQGGLDGEATQVLPTGSQVDGGAAGAASPSSASADTSSSSSDDDEEEGVLTLAKRRKRLMKAKANRFIDAEAAEEDEDGNSVAGSDDSEDEEAAPRTAAGYVADGFVVAEGREGGSSSSEDDDSDDSSDGSSSSSGASSDSDSEDDSDDEDEEDSDSGSGSDSDSSGAAARRRPALSRIRKLRHVEKNRLDEDDLLLLQDAHAEGKVDADTVRQAARRALSRRDDDPFADMDRDAAAARAAAGAGAGGEEEGVALAGARRPREEDDDNDSYVSNSSEDWIVRDGEGADGGEGAERAGRAARKRRRVEGGAGGYQDDGFGAGSRVTNEQLQTFDSIFGRGSMAVALMTGEGKAPPTDSGIVLANLYDDDDDGLLGGAGSRGRKRGGEEEDEEEEGRAVRARGAAGAAAGAAPGALPPPSAVSAALATRFEPGVLAKHFMRDVDTVVRVTDAPERLQLTLEPRHARRRRLLAARQVAPLVVAGSVTAASVGGRKAAPKKAPRRRAAPADAVSALFDDDDEEDAGAAAVEQEEEAHSPAAAAAAPDAGSEVASTVYAVATHADVSRAGEAAWIATRLTSSLREVYSPDIDVAPHLPLVMSPADAGLPPHTSSSEVRAAVASFVETVLGLVYDHALEIPFIWAYKKDTLAMLPAAKPAHLWAVLDLDDAWTRVQARRLALAQLVDKAVAAGACSEAQAYHLRDLLLLADTDRALEDVADYAKQALTVSSAARKVRFDAVAAMGGGSGLVGEDGSALGASGAGSKAGVAGLATRFDLFSAAVGSDVRGLVEQIYLPAKDLAANLRAAQGLYTPPAAPEEPQAAAQSLSDLAFETLCAEFSTEEEVLRAALHVAAHDLAREPYLRAHLRRQYFAHARLRTDPTEAGRRELEPTHPLFGVHTLRGKSLAAFVIPSAARLGMEISRPSSADALGADPLAALVDEEIPAAADDVVNNTRYSGVDALGLSSGFGSPLATYRVYADAAGSESSNPESGAPPSSSHLVVKGRMEARVGGFTQWALIARGEKSKYLTVDISLDPAYVRTMVDGLCQHYLSSAGSIAVLSAGAGEAPALTAFDRQRRAAVVTAVETILLPEFAREVRSHLDRVAGEAIHAEYANALRKAVLTAPPLPPPRPLRKRKAEDSEARQVLEEPLARYPWQRARFTAMAIVPANPGRDPRGANDVAVLVDKKGELRDFVELKGRRPEQAQALAQFMFAHAPDAVVVSPTAGMRARDLKGLALQAALVCEDLVKTARENYRKRKELIKQAESVAEAARKAAKKARAEKKKREKEAAGALQRSGRGRGMSDDEDGHAEDDGGYAGGVVNPAESADPTVRMAWKEAHMSEALEPLAAEWASGKYKEYRPRAPARKKELNRSGLPEPDEAGPSSLAVYVLEDEVSRVYATSPRGKAEFPDHAPVVRHAVSLGRFLQDPLAEVAYMWATRADPSMPGVSAALSAGVAAVPADLAAARLHPLERDAPPHLLYLAAERVLVEAVNAVGVDINDVAGKPHLAALLQFVAGLGPRKATELANALSRRSRPLVARSDLITLGLLPRGTPTTGGMPADPSAPVHPISSPSVVFHNAAGFLRVAPPTWTISSGRGSRKDKGSSKKRGRAADEEEDAGNASWNEFASDDEAYYVSDEGEEGASGGRGGRGLSRHRRSYNPLDRTRIHPSCYALAALLASNAGGATEASPSIGQPALPALVPGSELGAVKPDSPATYTRLVRLLMRRSQHMLWKAVCTPGGDVFTPGPSGLSYCQWSSQQVERTLENVLTQVDVPQTDVLSTLDCAQFCDALRDGFGPALRLLEGIKAELRAPFRDARRPYQPLTPEALFRLLTRETYVTLRPGVLLPVRVTYVGDNTVKVRLDTGLNGVMEDPKVAQGQMRDHYTVGQMVLAQVKSISRASFSVSLRAVAADADLVAQAALATPPPVDAACDVDAAMAILLEVARKEQDAADQAALEASASAGFRAAAKAGTSGYVFRGISHPFFKNITRAEAESMLGDQPLYSVVFRPSSQGTDHLTLTWKLAEPRFCAHLDVLEKYKEGLPPTALGRRLVLDGGFEYADLDEILARHIEPMSRHHRSLRDARCKFFRDAPQAAVDEELTAAIAAEPNRIPYLLYPNAGSLGHYLIGYIVKSRAHHESVKVLPGGFRWRGVVSPNWHTFINDFKARCRTRPEVPNPAAAAAAAGGMPPGAAAAPVQPYGQPTMPVPMPVAVPAQGGYYATGPAPVPVQGYGSMYGGAAYGMTQEGGYGGYGAAAGAGYGAAGAAYGAAPGAPATGYGAYGAVYPGYGNMPAPVAAPGGYPPQQGMPTPGTGSAAPTPHSRFGP